MCAGSNPPSVFTIFRFAAYLNLVQEPLVLFGLAPCGSAFFIPFMEISGFAIIVRHIGFFSAPLPTISGYPSPDRISCMEGGVSSAVAACRAPAHIIPFHLLDLSIARGFVPVINNVPNSLFHFFLLFKSLMCFVLTPKPAF